ncbi:hypothetical protein JMG10_01685 [Nostoc ellipsosporum NOK]|jgi:hypothetical protein|nr:hypothetical protein [Nostoc ellipsosporum NOK]
MNCNVTDFSTDSRTYRISGISETEFNNSLELFLAARNLKYKSDKAGMKLYTRGNLTMRILLGVFVKYFRIGVSGKRIDDQTFEVTLKRPMNFFVSGGVIGVRSSRKEFDTLAEDFKNHFTR